MITRKTPNGRAMGGVSRELLGENRPRYIGNALYNPFAQTSCGICSIRPRPSNGEDYNNTDDGGAGLELTILDRLAPDGPRVHA